MFVRADGKKKKIVDKEGAWTKSHWGVGRLSRLEHRDLAAKPELSPCLTMPAPCQWHCMAWHRMALSGSFCNDHLSFVVVTAVVVVFFSFAFVKRTIDCFDASSEKSEHWYPRIVVANKFIF